ncbi:cell division septal protein [Cylindrospermum stagnale PCC 7417]|uniref:Cell division septal protein n=1 Tax=Cylindrospermum stagnale PCC 7417 TaxID=56107 RepID=K9X2R8_9NOST|nr:FtsQ-type POTRA domain-containing protein [Cylindrospermum stagnale]AFZ26356.1 cell division septal protein [Cylindrospermum stagnale PCC 7417]
MAGIVSVSRTDLAQRRKKLRRQRQMKIIQAIWRTFAVTGLAGGLLWAAIQPMWVLNAPAQIVIKSGNQLLSDKVIQSLLVLSYPQSLWRIEPNAIAKSLQQQPTIAQATVSRRLFPPGLMIEIKERVPVAIALRAVPEAIAQTQKEQRLLDASGVLMPLEKYKSLNPTAKLPSLKVIGSPEKYRPYWTQIYQAVSQSSVKVMEINCQDPTNLILKTELGKVHLGAFITQLPEQIKVLAQMRHLPTKLNPSQIEYIDLKNPEFPLVQMNQNKQQVNSQTR